MRKIKLIKMGMNFYSGTETGDMGNFRLRPSTSDSTNCYIKLKEGGYIAGDFIFWAKNNTNNKDGDRLHMDFTKYDDDKECDGRYKGFEKYTKQLEPTLANIKMLLEEATGEQVKLTITEN